MKKGAICIIAGLLLIAAALSLIGYNLWDNRRAGDEAQGVLAKLLPEIEKDPIPKEGRIRHGQIEYPDYIVNPNMEMPVKQIEGHNCIGLISIPAMGKELPVFEEWSYPELRTAPCRYMGSAYLDNMVICAHNYARHFGEIADLSYGSTVIFTDIDGNVFNYRVVEVETLQPTDIDRMTTGDWDLTLFTCTIGGATRVTVRCERV